MVSNRKTRRTARRLFQMCVSSGRLDEGRVRTAAARVATSRRRGSMAILWEFLRLVRVDIDRYTAHIASAAPLPRDLEAAIVARLNQVYGAGVRTIFAVDPALIGGLRIQVGSDVYDGSIRTRLSALDASL